MFKSRITKWGLDKKIKEREARAILKILAQRNVRLTKLRLRGQSVDIPKLENYFSRKGISIEDVLSSDCPSSSSVDLVCRSLSPAVNPSSEGSLPSMLPTASPDAFVSRELSIGSSGAIPPRLEAPDGLKMVEHLFVDVCEYMSCFEQDELSLRWHTFSAAITPLVIDLSAPESRTSQSLPVHQNRVDLSDHLVNWLVNISQAMYILTTDQRCQVIYENTIAPATKDGPPAITKVLKRIFSSFRQLLKKGEPYALILRSLWIVMKDNVENLLNLYSRHNDWVPSAIVHLLITTHAVLDDHFNDAPWLKHMVHRHAFRTILPDVTNQVHL